MKHGCFKHVLVIEKKFPGFIYWDYCDRTPQTCLVHIAICTVFSCFTCWYFDLPAVNKQHPGKQTLGMRSWQDGAGGQGHSSVSVSLPACPPEKMGGKGRRHLHILSCWLFNLGLFYFEGHWFFGGVLWSIFFEKILNLLISNIWPQKLHQ